MTLGTLGPVAARDEEDGTGEQSEWLSLKAEGKQHTTVA